VTRAASPPNVGQRMVVARTVEELEPLRDAWRRLQGRHFATDPDLFPTILEWQPQAVRPHVILLERDGEPRVLVVARVEDIRLPTKLGYKALWSPRVRSLTVVYRGVLGEPTEAEAQILLAELRRSLADGEADVLRLRNLEIGSTFHRLGMSEPPAVLRERASLATAHWEQELPGSFDEFLRSLSKSTRESAKRYPKRLVKQFGDRLSVEIYRDVADIERIFADTSAVAEKTYQQGLGVAFAQTELQRRMTGLLMERGWFRAYVLYLDGDPIAFWQGHAYNGMFSTGVPGYDPAYADLRVGTFVLLRLIEDLCEDPEIDTLDYGFGDAEYKRRFGTRSWQEHDVHVYAPTAKGIGTNAVRSSLLGLVGLARRGLERNDALGRIKRGWRDKLSQPSGR
jgi:CelD/BcsL family acetyltransferase involved in cellulose biosynthesis